MGGASEVGLTVFPVVFTAVLTYYARAMSEKAVLS